MDKVVRRLRKTPISGIYIVTNNVNGKRYVGQSIDIERRWNQHRYGKGSLLLRNAIKKYGIENFSFEVKEEVDDTLPKPELVKLLIEKEQEWLDKTNRNVRLRLYE
jgi:group I intron endonuclease